MLDQATARATMKWQVAPGREPIRLDAFVRECLPHLSRREVDQAIRDGFFSIDGRVARKGDRLSVGDTLVFGGPAALLAANPLPDTSLDVPIVYEDSSILIVDKPAGIATHGFSGRDMGTLANYIAAQRPHLLGVGKNRWDTGSIAKRQDLFWSQKRKPLSTGFASSFAVEKSPNFIGRLFGGPPTQRA